MAGPSTLVAALASSDEGEAERAERALLAKGEAIVPSLLAALPASVRPQRGRIAKLLARLADARALEAALTLVGDADPVASRFALRILGAVGGAEAERVLLARAGEERRPAHLRTLADALVVLGTPKAREALARLSDGDTKVAVAKARGERDAARETETEIAKDVALPDGTELVLRTREGFEDLLAAKVGGKIASPGVVVAPWGGSTLARTLGARTWITIGVRLGPVPRRGELAKDVASLVGSARSVDVLRRLTRGPIRYRVHVDESLSIAFDALDRAVREKHPELRNDPTDAPWELVLETGERALRGELRPKAFDDDRFAYRARDVPAASHPALAAALAELGGVRPDDVVWDPFCGSALELCERHLLGPSLRLVATDFDDRALEAARTNLRRVGAKDPVWFRADARAHNVPGTTLVLTNPPMGRRVGDRAKLGSLLDQTLENVAANLVPGGRMVWISPMAGTARVAARLGLRIGRQHPVDMGGFHAELQAFTKDR